MSPQTEPRWKHTAELREQVKSQAPVKPRKGPVYFLVLMASLIVLIWAFDGADLNSKSLYDLFHPSPKSMETLQRLMQPDFSKVREAKSYNLPKKLTVTELLMPTPLSAEKEQIKRRWWNNAFPNTVVGATIQTIQMALAGTVLALVFAFPLAFLAAENTSPHPLVYRVVRFFINLLRTVPDFALGLVFVGFVGLGPFAGTLALAVHTMTVLTKLLSESVENIDGGVVEAIRATGSNYGQMLSFAVLPQMLPDLISFTLYRFETNIRSASVLGLIGAGGIGHLLNTAFRTFNYAEASAIVLILIILVMGVDFVSARLRKWVI